eukprot:Lithocolla_globosa_v1_NODE_2218_length_2105_cov_2.588780.p2 type:complete len:133 gc:universal NODE_2218_length_2105_cov_2.588780:394-792(+)
MMENHVISCIKLADPDLTFPRSCFEVTDITIRQSELMEDQSRNYVVYKVEVSSFSNRWFVYRRYSEFEELHNKLKDSFAKNLSLPPKFNISSVDSDRLSGLNLYLFTLLSNRSCLRSSAVRDFFFGFTKSHI